MKEKDKELLIELSSVLKVSVSNLRLDEYLDWNIFGGGGTINTDGKNWYLYLPLGTKRKWNRAKDQLSFLEVTQDGDDEGILKMTGMPNPDQAEKVRKFLRLRKSVPYTEEQRSALIRRLNSPCKEGVSSLRSDLND